MFREKMLVSKAQKTNGHLDAFSNCAFFALIDNGNKIGLYVGINVIQSGKCLHGIFVAIVQIVPNISFGNSQGIGPIFVEFLIIIQKRQRVPSSGSCRISQSGNKTIGFVSGKRIVLIIQNCVNSGFINKVIANQTSFKIALNF